MAAWQSLRDVQLKITFYRIGNRKTSEEGLCD
jgi:hypothetical protein